jgi:hypothetical protein
VGGGEVAEGGRRAYAEKDPLAILENIRREAQLEREDLAFRERTELGNVVRANFVMTVTGSFSEHLRFLRELERAVPLVTVQKLTMVDRPNEPGLALRLDLSVLTPPEAMP